jgi:outer membrane protein OmpA-like peptidoglycan-associated protein
MAMTNIQPIVRFLVIGTALIVGAAGCTTMGESPALNQARFTYMQAQQNPQIATNAPVALREAEQAVQQAEKAWKDDGDEAEVQHLAYVAERKVNVAQATAEQKVAEAEVQRLGEERDRVLLDSRSREARQAQQQAQSATARATQLEQELKELQAKETERGLELTLGDVLFEVNQATLKPGAMRHMYQLAEVLRQQPTRHVLIKGHTDSSGSDSYNFELSQRRAESVRDFLISTGVSPDRITARGYGEAYPVASNDTTSGRQQNRRVAVVISR